MPAGSVARLPGAQVDEHVDERVRIGSRVAVAQMGPLDAQGQGSTVDALGGGALGDRPPGSLR